MSSRCSARPPLLSASLGEEGAWLIAGNVMWQMCDAFGVPLQVGDTVFIRDGTFVGEVGEVVGYHWRPCYPKVRLTLFGRPAETWFQSHQLERRTPNV